MKKGVLLIGTLAAGYIVAGCGSSDDQYGQAAPPPAADAVAGGQNPNKQRPGALSPTTGGAGGAAGTSELAQKPAGE